MSDGNDHRDGQNEKRTRGFLRIDSSAPNDCSYGVASPQGRRQPFDVQRADTLGTPITIGICIKCMAGGGRRQYSTFHRTKMLFRSRDKISACDDSGVAIVALKSNNGVVQAINRRRARCI